MKKTIGLILFLFFINVIYTEDFKEIEECVSIENNEARLKCFDSFFISDKKLILVDQEQVIFEEKQSPKTNEKFKLKIQAERSIIEKNLVLVGVRFTGISYIFELNDLDTSINYKVFLNIRHSVEYKYQNIFLFSKTDYNKDTLDDHS